MSEGSEPMTDEELRERTDPETVLRSALASGASTLSNHRDRESRTIAAAALLIVEAIERLRDDISRATE